MKTSAERKSWLRALFSGLAARLPLDFSGEVRVVFRRGGVVAVHQLAVPVVLEIADLMEAVEVVAVAVQLIA